MKNIDRKQLLFINAVYILLLAAVLFPLLVISKYNYPSADDWSFGIYVHEALKHHEGMTGAIKAVIRTVAEYYQNWEGRFCSVLFASFQPGVFGEHWYGMVAYLMIGSVILSELFLISVCLKVMGNRTERLLILPLSIPFLSLQLLYCPYPEESFYWYTGAVNYTFIYSISLVLIGMVLYIAFGKIKKKNYIIILTLACLLAIMVGGNNFATSLSTLCTLVIVDIVCVMYNKPAFKRIWLVTVPLTVSLYACVFSPGSQKRLDGNFEGKILYSPVKAVGMSLTRSFSNIIGWFDWKVLFVILLVLPFLWKTFRQLDYDFKLPGLFTLVTFCLYSSQITATLYVDGTTGGGRQGAILWYSYLMWIMGNIWYWLGWICNKTNGRIDAGRSKVADKITGKYLLPYCAMCGIALLGIIYLSGIEETTSYRAYRLWRNGWAKQYGEAWEARLEVLKDDTIKEVEFKPLQPIELIMYTDLQPEDGFYWVTNDCAKYYEKDHIHIVTEKE